MDSLTSAAAPEPTPPEPAAVETIGLEQEPAELEQERRTSSAELFWDLVFVFAITQVTALLSGDLTWRGFGRSMLVLALVWWAWSAFVWAANAQPENSPTMRATLLVGTVFILIVGLSVPHAFTTESTLFACSYAVVRFLHLALYADASRKGNASWGAIVRGFGVTVLVGMALLIAGSFFNGAARTALWAGAVAIDYAGPAWLTRARLRGLQRVAVAHFAERYGTFIILCLGESIVAIGVGARNQPVDAELVAVVALGLVIAAELWWSYFSRFADVAQERLRTHDDPVLVAADAYSYLHLVLVAGIIIFAVGVKDAVLGGGEPLREPARLALCGGVAVYLLGEVAFRMRMVRVISYERVGVAALSMVLFAISGGLAAWVTAGLLAVLLGGLCVLEQLRST